MIRILSHSFISAFAIPSAFVCTKKVSVQLMKKQTISCIKSLFESAILTVKPFPDFNSLLKVKSLPADFELFKIILPSFLLPHVQCLPCLACQNNLRRFRSRAGVLLPYWCVGLHPNACIHPALPLLY